MGAEIRIRGLLTCFENLSPIKASQVKSETKSKPFSPECDSLKIALLKPTGAWDVENEKISI